MAQNDDNRADFDLYNYNPYEETFRPLSRNTMTRCRTDYRPRSVAEETANAGEMEYMHPPTLPDLFSSKAMPPFADYRFDDERKHAPFSLESPEGKDFSEPALWQGSPFAFSDDDGIDETHVPSARQNAMLAEFSRSADELDALFNESASSGRILELPPLKGILLIDLDVGPHFNINTSFISFHSLDDIMMALELALRHLGYDPAINAEDGELTVLLNDEDSNCFNIKVLKIKHRDGYVIEFRRRCGDVMAFYEFYRKVLYALRNPPQEDAGEWCDMMSDLCEDEDGLGFVPRFLIKMIHGFRGDIVHGPADPRGALPPNEPPMPMFPPNLFD